MNVYSVDVDQAGLPGPKIVRDLSDRDRVITNGPDPRTTPRPS